LHRVGEEGAGTTAGCLNAACERVTWAVTIAFNQVKKETQPSRRGNTPRQRRLQRARQPAPALQSNTEWQRDAARAARQRTCWYLLLAKQAKQLQDCKNCCMFEIESMG
jgi:hypothetical protein